MSATAAGAAPGIVDIHPAELARAMETSSRSRQSLIAEQRRARIDRSVEQQRRVDDAERDLIAAEAFEESLDDGEL